MRTRSSANDTVTFPGTTPSETESLIARIGDAVVARLADAPLLVDAAELSKRLGVSPSAIGRAVKAGTIPSVRLGSRRLFDPREVLAALRAAETKGGDA